MKNVLFLLLALCLQANAQDSLQYLSWTDGAACYQIEELNDYLYTGNGNTFKVFDASGTPPYPEVYSYKFLSTISDIVIIGNELYMAVNHSGLYKWDISTPTAPSIVASYETTSFDDAAWDISFYGSDTLFVTYKKQVAIFRDLGTSFSLETTFAPQVGNSIVKGGAINDTLYAYTQQLGGATDGIYIVDARDLTPYGFHYQSFAEPEDVMFGELNPHLLHVLGGSQNITIPWDPRGLFYTLDVTNPTSPSLLFIDTLTTIPGLGMALPVNADMRNDTIFIATTAAQDINYAWPDPATGHVYIYDLTDEASINLINTVYAGLWHFDLALHGNLMQVASEWYGIETIDISDIFNEVALGKTLTGGWNWGTGVKGDTMVVCNGGYGFKVFDITDPRTPIWTNVNYDSNFVKNAVFSEDGQYLYAFFLTNDAVRVYETANYTQVGGGLLNQGHERLHRYNNLLVVHDQPTIGIERINFIDISSPLVPVVDSSMNYNCNDYVVRDDGLMFVTNNDTISVWDLSNNYQSIASVNPLWFEIPGTITEHDDTVFVYITNVGLVRYLWNGSNLTQDAVVPLPYGAPDYMASDGYGLYICYHEYGLYAYDKATMMETGYYMHGLEFMYGNVWGPQDLFCDNGLIFLVEWFGQTTILSNDNGMLVSLNTPTAKEAELTIFPNPTLNLATISFSNPHSSEVLIIVHDANGRLVFSQSSTGNALILDAANWNSGTYIVSVQKPNTTTSATLVVGTHY